MMTRELHAAGKALRSPEACRLVTRWCGDFEYIPQSLVAAAMQRVPEDLPKARACGAVAPDCDAYVFRTARMFLKMAARDPRGIIARRPGS